MEFLGRLFEKQSGFDAQEKVEYHSEDAIGERHRRAQGR
jgi:hypothetical protein